MNERIQSMQAVFENNDRQLKFEIKQMQNSYAQKLQQAQDKEALSAQELNLQYLVAENKMNSTIASLRTHLAESQARARHLQNQRQSAEPERSRASRPALSPISIASPSNPARSPHLPDAEGPPRSFSPAPSFFGRKRSSAGVTPSLVLPGATLAQEMRGRHPTLQLLVLPGATLARRIADLCRMLQPLVLPGATLA